MPLKYSIRENMAPGNSILEKFHNLAEIGIEGIEITASSSVEHADEIRKASEETGVTPNIFSIRGTMGLLDARLAERRQAAQDLKDALTLCGDLGGVGVIFPPLIAIKLQNGHRIPDLSPFATTAQLESSLLTDILKQDIAPHAETCGCSVIIEPLNRYEQWWPCTLADGLQICNAVNRPGVTLMADFFHMSIEESDMAQAIRSCGELITNVHLADSNRILPGYGHTDFRPALQALEDIGYRHYSGFECAIPPGSDPKAELKKSMDYLNSLH
jgi:sugar phosphate isomerase/epimerase